MVILSAKIFVYRDLIVEAANNFREQSDTPGMDKNDNNLS